MWGEVSDVGAFNPKIPPFPSLFPVLATKLRNGRGFRGSLAD